MEEIPFQDGEKLDYIVYYNLNKLWVPGGTASFEVRDTILKGNTYTYFKGYGKTIKKFDAFFKVRDSYESIVDPETLKPIRFMRDVLEGPYELKRDYVFSHSKGEAYAFTDDDGAVTVDTVELEECAFDVISAVFYTRTIDFSGFDVGEELPIKLVLDKQIYHTELIYDGKTVFEAPDKNEYNCIKFKLRLIEGTLFKEGSEMDIYVTDDKNRIPLFVEAEILVGSVKCYLLNMENIKYDITSKVD